MRAESGGGGGICHVLWVHSVLRLTQCPRFWGQVLQSQPCLYNLLKLVTYICWHWLTFLLFATNILEGSVRLPMAIRVEELLSLLLNGPNLRVRANGERYFTQNK